ncbi:MAG: thiamine phosphate synthase, partial [Beijerinckiaceae bacterium]
KLEPLLADPLVACVLLAGTAETNRDNANLKALVKRLQRHDIAVLFEDMELAKATDADGLHIRMEDEEDMSEFRKALRSMKPGRIVGAGNMASRHAAMTAAEEDIDYVMFGEYGQNERKAGVEAVAERAAWWAEIFTTPCVAMTTDVSKISEIAGTGCEFIGMSFVEEDGTLDPANMLNTAIQAIRSTSQCAT